MTTWADVGIDTYIRAKDDTVWRVVAIDLTEASEGTTGALRLKGVDESWATLNPMPLDGEVAIVDEADFHIPLLRDKLGALEIARQNRGTPPTVSCPSWPEKSGGSLDQWKLHLHVMHGIYAGDINSYPRLVATHDAQHAIEDQYRPHTH